jgi:hypothetical protein
MIDERLEEKSTEWKWCWKWLVHWSPHSQKYVTRHWGTWKEYINNYPHYDQLMRWWSYKIKVFGFFLAVMQSVPYLIKWLCYFRYGTRQHTVWEACHGAKQFTSCLGAKEQKQRNLGSSELPWQPISKDLQTHTDSYLLHEPTPSNSPKQEIKSLTFCEYWSQPY